MVHWLMNCQIQQNVQLYTPNSRMLKSNAMRSVRSHEPLPSNDAAHTCETIELACLEQKWEASNYFGSWLCLLHEKNIIIYLHYRPNIHRHYNAIKNYSVNSHLAGCGNRDWCIMKMLDQSWVLHHFPSHHRIMAHAWRSTYPTSLQCWRRH